WPTAPAFPWSTGCSAPTCPGETTLWGGLTRKRRVAGEQLVEQGVHERVGVERRQVVDPLAQADQLDRHTELTLHSDDDAALGGAVQLGQHDAGDIDDLGEHPGLLQP